MVGKNSKTPRTKIVQDVNQKSKSKDLAMHHKLVCCLMSVEHKSFILGDKVVRDSNHILCTGKSLSEALLFAEHGGEHVVYKNYSECWK